MCAAAILLGCGCRERAPEPAPAAEPAPAPTNRVDIPAPVRQNLGITFARAEVRAVTRTVRVPGRFELLPNARRDYHAPLAGRVELLVEPYQRVEQGAALFRLDSPGWRQLQQQIAEAQGEARRAQGASATIGPLMEAHHRHHEELGVLIRVWTDRVARLGELAAAGGGQGAERAEAEAKLAVARADLAEVLEKEAELQSKRAEIDADLETARVRLELLLASAGTLTGIPAAELAAVSGSAPPLWRALVALEVRAAAPGVVGELPVSTGAWVEENTRVLSVVRPMLVRFHAKGLQSDLLRLRDGLAARVVPPAGGSLGPGEVMQGELVVGIGADPDGRTVDLLMTPSRAAAGARAGVWGFLEVVAEGSGGGELAVPLAAVIRDGVTPVIFRRDPRNPDLAIRLAADLGMDDGRWVVVRSGLREGDEVVLDGVYQLMLATSGSAPKGGHFHSDGTFHEGDK
ncbi:MAG: hypothetical protein WD749_14305 [Phycisphaerales bacterium]